MRAKLESLRSFHELNKKLGNRYASMTRQKQFERKIREILRGYWSISR